MPDLIHTLNGSDLPFLKIVASLWGIELDAPDAQAALNQLVNAMLDPRLLREVTESLPRDQLTALQALLQGGYRMPWQQFSRRYGEVRVMGAARRDRERPDLNPISVAEALWYRGMIGRAFLNLPPAPEEYAYIPDDLATIMALPAGGEPVPYGRPADSTLFAIPIPAQDSILDYACTLLAALRLGMDPYSLQPGRRHAPVNVLLSLLQCCGLCDAQGQVIPDPAREFLEAGRPSSLAMLVRGWISSADFNELHLLPDLVCEGDWHNDPLQARSAIIGMLKRIPHGEWWDLDAFIAAVHEMQPDFQRPGGDYDSWFIRRASDGAYLRGFSSWGEVDGALLRFFITGPLHWLGLYDLAKSAPGKRYTAFRASAWSVALFSGEPPRGLPPEVTRLKATADGLLRLPARFPLSLRYQVARFCEWEKARRGEYIYRLTAATLYHAARSGLKSAQLAALLRRYGSPLLPSLSQALQRWDEHAAQAFIEKMSLLQVESPEILQDLLQSSAAAHLVTILNPTTVIIKAGHELAVRDALAQIGYLAEIR